MPQLRYRAVTHAAEIVGGEVDASSREEVARRIEYPGRPTMDATIAASGTFDRDRNCSVGLRSDHCRGSDTAPQAGAVKMQRAQARVGCDGFTLIEVLAALAIALRDYHGQRCADS